MASLSTEDGHATALLSRIGRSTVGGIEQFGRGAALVAESGFWLLLGFRERQPVRVGAVFAEMMEVGVRAVPIVTVMAATIGVMLAIQGIHTLKLFGAEDRVTLGIALSITREFAPLITAVLVAGRSGSAFAARLGTMKINEEIDALRVMGISPVRFLAVPALLACLIMLPALTIYSDFVGMFAAGLYVSVDLGLSLTAFADEALEILTSDDILHGIGKSAIFAVLIAVIGVLNGAAVTGGAEGVGRYTTRAVVQSISAIVITDMLFVFVVTR